MDRVKFEFNDNIISLYTCIRKKILNEDESTKNITKYIFDDIIVNKVIYI